MKLPVYNIQGQTSGREVELPESIFGLEINDNVEHVVYLAVKQYQANQRQGTHKSKQRNEISGSTRKLHRQKGTGGSRKGSIKNPLFHGGGRIFGPQPRDYEQKLNKKVKRLARKAVLTAKAQEGRIVVVEDLAFDAPKTKTYASFLDSVKVGEAPIASGKSLLVLDAPAVTARPQAPSLPNKPRGSKKRSQYAEAMKAYSIKLKAYKAALKAYEAARGEQQAKLDKAYTNVVLSSRNIPGAATVDAKLMNVYDVINANYLVLSESSVATIAKLLGGE